MSIGRTVARKLTVLCWHLLTRIEDCLWARPALVANKTQAMELQAGHPQYNREITDAATRTPTTSRTLRDKEMLIASLRILPILASPLRLAVGIRHLEVLPLHPLKSLALAFRCQSLHLHGDCTDVPV